MPQTFETSENRICYGEQNPIKKILMKDKTSTISSNYSYVVPTFTRRRPFLLHSFLSSLNHSYSNSNTLEFQVLKRASHI